MQTAGTDDYYMSIAFVNALRSEDPNTKVGACIVNAEGSIVGSGYNRMPKTSNDCRREYSWSQTHDTVDDWLMSKYPYILYAEMDAILNKKCESLQNCTLYSLIFPANESAKLIVEVGINKVVYYVDKYPNNKHFQAAKNLFRFAGIDCIEFEAREEKYRNVLKSLAKETVEKDFLCIDSYFQTDIVESISD